MKNKYKDVLISIFDDKIRIPLIIILFGVIIRVVLMPISAHPDLVMATWREHIYASYGFFRLSDFSEIFLALYLKIFRFFFNNNFDQLFYKADIFGDIASKDYSDFITSFRSMRYIFFLKLPYLFLDLILLYFVWNIFSDKKKKLRMLAFWAFNPLLLFAVYIWGRYEIIPIFFIIIAIYFLKNNKYLYAMILVGISIATRLPFLLLLPFFIIYCSKSKIDYIKNFIIAVIPFIILNRINHFVGGETVVSGLERGQFFQYFTNGQIGSGWTGISLFLIGYPIVVYYFYRERTNMDFKKFIVYSTIGFLTFFSNAKYNPQYLSWISPLIMISYAINKKILLPFIVLAISYIIYIDTQWEQTVTWGLFRPLNDDFFGHILALYHQIPFDSYGKNFMLVFSQSVFVLMSVIIAILLFRDKDEKNQI